MTPTPIRRAVLALFDGKPRVTVMWAKESCYEYLIHRGILK